MTQNAQHAAIYARLSQDRTGAHVVVERQERECRELARSLGWEVARVFVDNDVSAFGDTVTASGKKRRKKARPGYRQLLQALEAGEVDGVLVWHPDRLHRSPAELERYIDLCEPRGVVTKTCVAGNLDLATPSGRMIARQLGVAARYEVERTAEKTQHGKADAADEGAFQGGQRMYGWEFVPKAERAPGGSALRVVPAEAAVVKDASRRVLDGESLRSIAKSLNATGRKTTRGAAWTGSALRKVLLRPSTAGLRARAGEVVGKGEWEALVPEATWRGVVALLNDPARRTNVDKHARTYLGSGLYVCGVCGGKLGGNSTAGGGPGNRRAAYRCRVSDRDGQVHVVRDAEQLDSLVVAVITERLRQPDAIEATRRPEVDIAPLHTEAAGLRAQLDQLATSWAKAELTQTQLVAASRELRRRLADVEKRIAGSHRTTVLDDLRDPGAMWPTLGLDRQRAIVDLLVTVTVLPRERTGRLPGGTYFDPTTIQIAWKRP